MMVVPKDVPPTLSDTSDTDTESLPPSETTTLLPSSPSSSSSQRQKVTPLPWGTISILLMLIAVQPMAFEIIFPFVNQMLVELRVVDDPEKVGFYSGIIESTFSFMCLLTVLPSSYASDRFGRKPIILLGMTGTGISIISFATGRTFASLIVMRCIGGALGGVWGAIKIMAGEVTDRTNQSTAFAALSISYRMGQVVGLPLGGFLAHPERQFPKVFDGPGMWGDFWRAYPFLLPCLAGGVFAFTSVALGLLYLEETLPSKRRKRICDLEGSVDKGTKFPQTSTIESFSSSSLPSPTFSEETLCLIPKDDDSLNVKVVVVVVPHPHHHRHLPGTATTASDSESDCDSDDSDACCCCSDNAAKYTPDDSPTTTISSETVVQLGLPMVPTTATTTAATTKSSKTKLELTMPPSLPITTPKSESSKKPMTFFSVLNKDIVGLMISNMIMCLASEMICSIFPIFAFTPVTSGGLGFSESDIGTYLSVRAILQIIITFHYSSTQRFINRLYQSYYNDKNDNDTKTTPPSGRPRPRFDVDSALPLYQIGMILWPIAVLFYPILNWLAVQRHAQGLSVKGGVLFNSVMFMFFLVWDYAGFCWTASGIIANDISPSAEALATVNGVFHMSTVLPQAIAPAFSTILFALSVRNHLMNGHLIWVVLLGLSCVGTIHAFHLEDVATDWRSQTPKKVT